jgi:RNA polymerase sigma-70 factor, ECF subfamily
LEAGTLLLGPKTGAWEADDFMTLLAPELPGAYRLSGLLLGNATDAEDATYEAVARAWQQRNKLRESDRFAAWFGRIVTNVCRDRLRRGRVVRLESLDGTFDLSSPTDQFGAALARDEIGRLVGRLSADQQIVVALRFWRDLPLEQIAEMLDVPLSTVKSRLYGAIGTLRAELTREREASR